MNQQPTPTTASRYTGSRRSRREVLVFILLCSVMVAIEISLSLLAIRDYNEYLRVEDAWRRDYRHFVQRLDTASSPISPPDTEACDRAVWAAVGAIAVSVFFLVLSFASRHSAAIVSFLICLTMLAVTLLAAYVKTG